VKIREKFIGVMDKLTGTAFWIFLLAQFYGIALWAWNRIVNPGIPIHTRIAIGSGVSFIFGLFIIFISDDMEPF